MICNLVALRIFADSKQIVLDNLRAYFEEGGFLIDGSKEIEKFGSNICRTIVECLTKVCKLGMGFVRRIPPAFGGTAISGFIAVAEGLYAAAIFGVNGGTCHKGGQSDRPVKFAMSGGNGSGMPAPSSG